LRLTPSAYSSAAVGVVAVEEAVVGEALTFFAEAVELYDVA